MYLSKIMISPSSKEASIDLNNPYQMHRTIMNAFPDGISREHGSILYRIELPTNTRNVYIPSILVQSKIKPNWNFINQKDNYLLPGDFINPAVMDFNPSIQINSVFRFRLMANPTRRNKNSKKLEPILTNDELLIWLSKKAEQSGFLIEPPNIYVKKIQVEQFEANQHKKKRIFTIHKVLFEGNLLVNNPQKFLFALENGIGRGRSFGCGLLSLAIS